MNSWKAGLDRKQGGTHYADRLQRILGVCQDLGLLWHEERVAFKSGATEMRRVDDIVADGTVQVTPQYEKYGLRVSPRVLNRLRGLGSQFAYALNVPSASVEIEGNIVYVRVPRSQAQGDGTVSFEQAWRIAPDIPRGRLLLGVDEEHQQLVIDLSAPTSVHAAVIGMTGSGKSTLMRTMILSAQMIGGAQVALFDPSGGFAALSGHPSVWRGGLFQAAEDCEAGLEVLANSLGRKQYGLLFAFVDEVPELIMQRPRIKDHLARLAQAGRHAGIHLVIGAQHPLASELGSLTMRNIPVRLVGKVADRSAAYLATGRGDSGAASLRGGGDFVVVNGSRMRHFQAAYVAEETLHAWQRRYPAREARVPVRACVTPMRRSLTDGVRGLAWGDDSAGGGRPQDEIPQHVIQKIQRYMHENGHEPSSNWVYRMTKSLLDTGGFNRAKARRAIVAAQQHQLAP